MESFWKIVGAIILALLGGLSLTLVIKKRNSKNVNKVTQKGNVVHGDMAGRDINRK